MKLQVSILVVSCSLEVQTTHRHNLWNQDDETDISRYNPGASFRPRERMRLWASSRERGASGLQGWCRINSLAPNHTKGETINLTS
ncbi:hypothetical protein LINPERPRIM_LOCUS4868 [Linum perenne]